MLTFSLFVVQTTTKGGARTHARSNVHMLISSCTHSSQRLNGGDSILRLEAVMAEGGRPGCVVGGAAFYVIILNSRNALFTS